MSSMLMRSKIVGAQPARAVARLFSTRAAVRSVGATAFRNPQMVSSWTRTHSGPISALAGIRFMSTENTTKAAFIDPTVAATSSTTSEDSATSVGTSAADILETATSEGSIAASTSASDAVLTELSLQNAEAITDVAMKYGDLKAMGLVNFTPVGGLEVLLEAIHISTGLPWWGTIVASTVMIRTLLIPFIVKLQGNTARLHNVKPQLERLTENMKLAKESNDSAALAKFSAQTAELFKKNDCNPVKSLALPLIQAPIMISFYLALRDMANLPVPQFQNGGTAWFTDLTIADPTYVLPVVSSLGFLAIMELGSEAGGAATPKNMKNFMRVMAVAMVPLTMNFPSAIFVYWLTSNVFTASQIMFFRNKGVRNFFNIPQLIEHPKPKVIPGAKQPGFIESFKASYEGGLAAKEREIAITKERENKLLASKMRRQNRKRL